MKAFFRMRRALASATLASAALAAGLAMSPASAAEVARENRPVSDVDRVVLRAIGELEIAQGSTESLVVEAEARLLPQITTEVKDRTLTIDIKGREFRTREPVRYRLQVKRLTGVEVAGSGSVRTAPLVTDRLDLVVTGSGDVRLAALTADTLAVNLPGSGEVEIAGGRVGHQQIRIDGGGQYVAPALRARDATVRIDGSGDARIAAEKSLDARIGGSGSVIYRGDPVVKQSIDGAGSIEREGTK